MDPQAVVGADDLHPQSEQDDWTGAPVTLAIIGAGQRGKRYASYALSNPKICRVIAVAEPRPRTRQIFKEAHQIPNENVFVSFEDFFLASEKALVSTGAQLADAVIVAVQDQLHAEVVSKCCQLRFSGLLCEKPMATTPEECIQMADAVRLSDCIFGVGHVLRYSPYNNSLVEAIRSGNLGELINVIQVEPVGHQHFAHSYVRGNWNNEQASSFSLMTKSCHDMDIVCHYLSPSVPKRVSSFGSLSHFKRSSKPAEAGEAKRCLECPIERECPYSAKRIYLDSVSNGHKGWPVSTLIDGPPDIENITEALKTGPYGECVYERSNNVADHQVVNIEFSNGSTCSFTMVAFTTLVCDRQTRLHFSYGEIIGDMCSLTITNFRLPPGHPERTTRITPRVEDNGHGGGDLGLIRTFVRAVGKKDQSLLGTDIFDVLRSHMVVFAAETSRREGKIVDVEDFEAAVRRRMGKMSNDAVASNTSSLP